VRRRRSWAVGCCAPFLLIYCDFVQWIMLSWDDFCPQKFTAQHTYARSLPHEKFAPSVRDGEWVRKLTACEKGGKYRVSRYRSLPPMW
jgi:hypothetical protein